MAENPLEQFKREHGKDWYLMVNSPMWAAAKVALLLSGPASALVSSTLSEITAFGPAIAARQQGWSSVIAIMENEMIVTEPIFDPTSEPASYSLDTDSSIV